MTIQAIKLCPKPNNKYGILNKRHRVTAANKPKHPDLKPPKN